MSNEKCPKFNTCNAPLCPLDKKSIEHGIWYPDEEVCSKRLGIDWVRKQKKIARKTKFKEGYFTVESIKNLKRISNKTKGEDPDKNIP